ncbi:nuclear transport factor 2 family protein [Actinomadura sp. WMMB 499]|uniref:nuclear transport factor 2 family protein n=1 Tax=Actinomadura sp. WMMB 499 TaxID=1219491 RepID=UPI00159E814E|nr:nuclear transport factor 2 family protein [Actinomadura sp. WMMB 499]
MPDQVAEIIERLYKGLAAADVEAVLSLFDPRVEIFTPPSLPWSTGHYAGLEGAAQYFGGALELLEETAFDVQEIRVSGDDWAAAIGDWSGRFREGGGEFDVRFVHFWTLADGKVIKGEGISDTIGIVRAHETGRDGAGG